MSVQTLKDRKLQSGQPQEQRGPVFLPPLKPRPALFILLSVVLLAWLGVLVWMKLKTVKPPAIQPTAVPQIRQQ